MVVDEQGSHSVVDILEEDADVLIHSGEELPESLWRVRAKLAWAGFKRNWKLFVENKIGLLGLGIIVLFAVMALAYPIMRTWGPWQDDKIYDPEIGYDAPIQDFAVVATDADVVDPATQIAANTAQLWCFGVVPGDVCTIPLQPAPPSEGHLLGTDPLGRDIAAQLAFSTRAAFFLGLIARRGHSGCRHDRRVGCGLLRRLARQLLDAAGRSGAPDANHPDPDRDVWFVDDQPSLAWGSDRDSLRIWRHRDRSEVPGSVCKGEAVYRRGTCIRRVEHPPHTQAHRPQCPATQLSVHDVHSH